MKLNNRPQLTSRRKELRNNLTPAEAKLWTLLKGSQLEGHKFRRQHSVGRYILDFYCPSERLAIELDGSAHDSETAQNYDRERTLFLQHQGIKVLRFENKWIFKEPDAVLAEIKASFGWWQPPRPLPPRPYGAPLLEKEGSFNSPPAKGEYGAAGRGSFPAKGESANSLLLEQTELTADTRNLNNQYTEALAFIKRNLHRVQGNQGFNSPGILEIPEVALQELLVNALVHRDYFTSAPIRIMVFTDRIDIISPGHLPDSLSIDDIRHGKTNRRNPTLAEHAFRLLPYRGMGSGIPRVLEEWPQIELISEVTGNQFTARVKRPAPQWQDTAETRETQVTGQVTGQVTEQVTALLFVMNADARSRKELMDKLDLKGRDNFEKLYLLPALEMALVERTIPDKPNSRLQKYRLTASGRQYLQQIKNEIQPWV